MTKLLDEKSQAALRAKIKLRHRVQPLLADIEPQPIVTDGRSIFHYQDCPKGTLIRPENIRLRWVTSDWFEYLPMSQPFGFERSSGQQILVGRMFTDGGSIPQFAWGAKGLSPWAYGPAYIVHDWLCDRHYCGDTTITFEDATDTILEVVKTLMEDGLCERNDLVFEVLYVAMHSHAARNAWNLPNPECPLP